MEKNIDITALRKKLKWTQAEMAEYLGLDRSSVSHFEAGRPLTGPARKLVAILSKKTFPTPSTRGDAR